MAKKKKKAAAAGKKGAKRALAKGSSKKRKSVAKKKAKIKKSAPATSTARKSLVELRKRYIAKTKSTSPRRSSATSKRGPLDSGAARDAEAIVLAEMPGVIISKADRPRPADAAKMATAHGASLSRLKDKYLGTGRARNPSSADASGPVRSKLVYVDFKDDPTDRPTDPKGVIVRDGKIHGFQG